MTIINTNTYYGPKVVSDGLILVLDAANPRSYPGSGTTWYDISGQNQHFTLHNSPTYEENKYIKFINSFDYVEGQVVKANISSPAGTPLFLETSPAQVANRTIEVWFRNDGPWNNVNNHTIIGHRLNESAVLCFDSTTSMRLAWRYDDALASTDRSSTLTPEGSIIQFVVCLENSNITYYRNGSLDREKFTSGDIVSANVTGWAIAAGERDFAIVNPFRTANISVSLVRQYNRELSADEIKQNFEATRNRFGI